MTIHRDIYSSMFALILCSFILAGCNGDLSEKTSSATAAQAGHEGHDHGPSEELGAETPDENLILADWCSEHAVPESECTKCSPSLIAGFKESGDWCAGHDLPESHCRLCNPGLSFPQEADLRAVVIDTTDMEIRVSLHSRPNATSCATDGALIQFATETTAERAGITVQAIRRTERETVTEAPAEILFDETLKTAITISVDALVVRWLVSPGDEVVSGDIIAMLQSPEIAQLKSSLVSAHANFKLEESELARHSQMKERGLISDLDWERQSARAEQARSEYVAANSQLLSAGLTEGDIAEIIEHGLLSNQLPLRAPNDGVIIERIAQLGSLLDAGSTFATIGEPEALWIEARLTEQQMRKVDLGDHLTFSSDGGAVNRVGGEIIWLSRFLDPHTRMGTVRARVLDRHNDLRAGEFGRVRIITQEKGSVCLVPKEAIQWEGCCNVVFVKETADRYRPRKVRLLDSSGPYYQVYEGLQMGEEVVVNGAFLMKTELKKSSIGAGCCGLEPVG